MHVIEIINLNKASLTRVTVYQKIELVNHPLYKNDFAQVIFFEATLLQDQKSDVTNIRRNLQESWKRISIMNGFFENEKGEVLARIESLEVDSNSSKSPIREGRKYENASSYNHEMNFIGSICIFCYRRYVTTKIRWYIDYY
ncbi:hypothetical protein RCL_jg21594.t1 [Rhizophagus clarus]|uniref:Uncharacterized protein n=1 Tax=Rhizophagus clarus TaxID=94130 RepID=A0A8H3L155_9GLOM|nr:hypothetical protein RCL_jg21594.t1 [Rhizophagus clarus]